MTQTKVLRIQRDDPLAWAWFPFVLARIAKFCTMYDTETEPLEMVDLVRGLFSNGDPRLFLSICIADHQVIGHILAMPEPFGSEHWKYMLIRQAEVDAGVDVRNETKQAFNEVVEWTRKHGLRKIMMLTHRREDSMAKRWGFIPYKAVMQMKLED